MKKIGILGGMTFESTVHYYYRINQQLNRELGGMNCAEMILYNLNFEFINNRMSIEDWEPIYLKLLEAAKKVEAAGADFLVIATNTMHRFYDRLQAELNIPILHIVDCVAQKCAQQEVNKVLLLGTIFTMKQDFLKKRLNNFGIEAVIPKSEHDLQEVHRVIIEELAFGRIKESSHDQYIRIINQMIIEEGIQAVILGCTEIEMLVKPGDVRIPVIDTTQAHVDGSVRYIIDN